MEHCDWGVQSCILNRYQVSVIVQAKYKAKINFAELNILWNLMCALKLTNAMHLQNEVGTKIKVLQNDVDLQ